MTQRMIDKLEKILFVKTAMNEFYIHITRTIR